MAEEKIKDRIVSIPFSQSNKMMLRKGAKKMRELIFLLGPL